jgi:hypothetical protein
LKRLIGILVFILLVLPVSAGAERTHSKRWYQDRWCAKNFGEGRVTVSDVYDCLSEKYVIEFDYADKWYESIGEALHYAMQTGKRAGIVLIMEREKDVKYWTKLNKTIRHYRLPIDTWSTRE